MDGIAMKTFRFAFILSSLFLTTACRPEATPEPVKTLRLATTTSTYDSGLLDAILPDFEAQYQTHVDVIAVGTGQALALGEHGDVDVVLVHAPSKEKPFVENGYGTQRIPVMYNDFIVVGPRDDPAHVGSAPDAATALTLIPQMGATFASRGDQSGTYTREMILWEKAGFSPSSDNPWYFSLGQGMGATLNFANEKHAYTLTDRGTFLALQEDLPALAIVFGGNTIAENPDPDLLNYYSVIPVNPERFSSVQAPLALDFVDWLTSLPVQNKISRFGMEKFGQTLFFPNSNSWKATHSDH